MFPEVLVVSSKLITILAVIVVVISVFSIGVFYLSAKSLFSTISGYATSTGTANLTVESAITINFTTNQINWGSGRVNAGSPSAGLNTFELANVTNGNWTLQTAGGLRIQNLGNINVTLINFYPNFTIIPYQSTFMKEGGSLIFYNPNYSQLKKVSVELKVDKSIDDVKKIVDSLYKF